jgi:hypothetical protein
MDRELLFFTTDVDQAKTGVAQAGGRVSHVLTEHLVVALLPAGVGLSSVPGAASVDVDRLDGMERRVAQAWIRRLGAESAPAERSATAGPSMAWDAPGHQPPGGPPQEASAPEATQNPPLHTGDPPVVGDAMIEDQLRELSTGTPTSRTLTGAVSVGIIMVSGPPEAWLFTKGALKHVSVASDGTVWGVNSADQIYRRDGTTWTRIPGALKQVSTGSANQIWGVNASDQIYQLA